MKRLFTLIALLIVFLGARAEEPPTQWKELITNGDAEKSWAELGLADVKYNDIENTNKICLWTREKGVNIDYDCHFIDKSAPHPAEIVELPEGGHAFICRATLADTPNNSMSMSDNQIWIESPRALKPGEQFKLSFRYKASEPVSTYHIYGYKLPDFYRYTTMPDFDFYNGISFSTEWQQFEKVVTVPSEVNSEGSMLNSVGFMLNSYVKTPVDFYIDDISWSEMELELEHGLFVAARNTLADNNVYDYDNAIQFEYDAEWGAMAATVGTVGDKESWVDEIMISTVRGNYRQFIINTIRPNGTVVTSTLDNQNWMEISESYRSSIHLAAGVWKILIDEDTQKICFVQLDGRVPDNIVPNPTEVVINTVERAMSIYEAEAAGLIASASNATDEEKALYSGNTWDSQFYLIGNRNLKAGEKVFVSFDYMATAPATVNTQHSMDAGKYLHWTGLGNIEFATDWQHFESTITIPEETKGNQNSWTFNLANAKDANEFHIKNIIFCDADKTETFIDMEGTENFWIKTGAGTDPYKFGNIPVSEVIIASSINELTVGETATLTATVLPENASEKTVTWSSSDTNVATVDAATGEVTAVGEGTATITATAADGSGVTGTCEITVKAAQGGNDDPSTGGTVDVTPRPTSGNYMFVDYVKAKAKQTVQIPVEVVTEEENIVGFQCNIKLPEGMEFVKNAKGNVVFTWNNDRIDGHTITSKIAADGSVKLLAASMNGSTFMETEGVMFYFSATVPEGMEGEQALQLYNVRVSDIDDNEIRCPDMTSVIDVKTFTLGDLNDDGEWSVVDVTMAIKAILDETYIEAGDMNEDGEMSVVDATTIIKYVLNEGPVEKASAAKGQKANAIADKPKFVVSPIYVEPGTNNMYLTVDMLNKEEYIGFQTEICLPEGFKFYTKSNGKPTVTLNTDRLETHTASSKLKDERTLRILVASMESDPILDNEGELLRVRVVAGADVAAGNHTATLIDSRVSDDDDIETNIDVTNGYLRVLGEEAISLVVPEGGYATLCLPYAATLPTGLKAYKATGIKDDTVILEEQSSIAACTPLVIQGTAGTYNFSGDNSGADEFEYSVGSLRSSLVPVENNSGYVLQNLSEGLGFYKIKDALTVPAFRTVLEGAAVNFAPAFVPVGFDEDANAISSVEAAMKNGSAVYTLDGKRVKTMEKGKIYIVGGVKMIVK